MSGSEGLATLLRVAVSLGAVLVLCWLLMKAARRRGAGRVVSASRVTVVSRQSLSKSAGVTVVRVGEEALVLGVTDAAVQLLARMPAAAVTDEPPAPRTEREDVLGEVRELSARSARPALAAVPDLGDDLDEPRATPLERLRSRRRVVAGASTRTARTTSTPQTPRPTPTGARRPLAGSALSPATWTTALEAVRERTARR